MARNEKAFPGGREMNPLNAATDTTSYNEPTYSGNEGNSGAEVVPLEPIPRNEGPGQLNSTSADVTPQSPRHRDPNLYYDMSGDKFLIIFNHFKYEKWQQPEIGVPGTRFGTDKDVERLEKTFRNRGFVVDTHDDCTYNEIKKYVTEMCEKNHTNTSCVAVAVMTHGLDTHLCAADILYPVTEITEPLKTTPNLAHKPKLFFIQACREQHIQSRTPQDEKIDIPMGADCLLLYSTYEDHVSYRDLTEGTWMMKALCEVIDAHHGSMNLAQMVTLVNHKVAREEFRDWNGDIFKQTPVTEIDLKKFLKF